MDVLEEHETQDRAAPEELRPGAFALPEQINALQDSFLRALRQRRVRIVLVHHREVIEHVLLLFQHAAHAVAHDHGELVAEARVKGSAIGLRGGDEMARSILVLKALARERGAPRRRPHEKAARAAIAGLPDEIANALKAENRIEDVERRHRRAVHAVSGRRSGPG